MNDLPVIPYAVVQRLRLIDVLLDNHIPVNRRILSDYFGITEQQVSHDLQQYQKLAPANMYYDLSAKAYITSALFKRMWA